MTSKTTITSDYFTNLIVRKVIKNSDIAILYLYGKASQKLEVGRHYDVNISIDGYTVDFGAGGNMTESNVASGSISIPANISIANNRITFTPIEINFEANYSGTMICFAHISKK